MKDCDFDPGAEAIVLIDVGELKFAYVENIGWLAEVNYRVRIKVLKASALNRAQVKMAYYSKNRNQDISNISGVSVNLDGSGNAVEAALEKKSIFNKQIDKERSEVSFALPDVRIGTVFEYKYKLTKKSFGTIPAWNFQQSIPVRYSAYNLFIPEYFKFTVQMTKRQEMESKQDKYKSAWYIMRNVPGLKDEPYSTGRDTYLQRVEFQLSKIDAPNYYYEKGTWTKIIEELMDDEDFGGALKKKVKGTDDLEMQLSNAKTVREKIRIIYKYVQSNMQWNDNYGIYSDNGIKDAWDKKNAGIADINFILIRLLQNADVDAKPLLASTKENGAINTIFPFLRQFNCVMAYVSDGDKRYIMNAADKYNSFDEVPYDVLYTNALVVDKAQGGVVGINSDGKYSSRIFFTVRLDADAKFSGNATLNAAGYARNIRESTYKSSKLKSLLEDNEGIAIKVDSISVKNEKDELLPFEQNIQFSGAIQSSGGYFFLPYGLFTGMGKNPFVEDNRVMDIDFDYPKKFVITGSYVLPENFTVSDLPKNVKMLLPDTSIVLIRQTQVDDNIISFRFTLDFSAPGYAAESYPYIKEFFKKMYEVLDERIVLKKK